MTNTLGRKTAIIISLVYVLFFAIFILSEKFDNFREFSSEILSVVYIVAIGPFLFPVLMYCGMNGSCTTVEFFGFGAIGAIGNMLLYSSIGYALVAVFQRVYYGLGKIPEKGMN